jgi:hypothetical protein
VVVPQQPVLQAMVLPSLRVAVALIWTDASSAMVVNAGAMLMLKTVLLLVTVTSETLLDKLLLTASTMPYSSPHPGTSEPVTVPPELTEI